MAAYYGKLECLKLFHERELPWNPLTCVAAIMADKQDCFEYAIKNECPIDQPYRIEAAASMGKLLIIKCLYELKFEFAILICFMP